MGPLDGAEVLPSAGKVGGQSLELFEVKSGQDFQPFGAVVGEMQSDNPMVVFVSGPGSPDRPASARSMRPTALLWMEEQIVGYLSDRRAPRITVAPYRQQ